MKILAVYLTLLLGVIGSVQSQENAWADSAEALLSTLPNDTNRVRALLNLAYETRYLQSEQSVGYTEEALKLANELNWTRGQANGLQFLGGMLLRAGENDTALVLGLQALELFRELGDGQGACRAMSDLGKANALLANFAEATSWYEQALAQAQAIDDTSSMAFAYSNLAATYGMIANLPKALENFQKGLELAEMSGDRQSTLLPLANIAQVHHQMGNSKLALDYFKRALTISKEFELVSYQASILANLIKIYTKAEDYEAAYRAHEEGMSLARQMKDKRLIASFYNTLHYLQKEEEDYEKALASLDSVRFLAESIGNTRLLLQEHMNRGVLLTIMAASETFTSSDALEVEAIKAFRAALAIIGEKGYSQEFVTVYEGLQEVYALQGNLDSTLLYYDRYVEVKDSIFSKEKAKEIANLEAVREAALKGKEVELLQEKELVQQARLNQERTIRYSLIGVFILILAALSWFIWSRQRINRLKLTNQQLESEQLQYELETKKKDLVNFALDNSKKRDWTQMVLAKLAEIKRANAEDQLGIINSLTLDLTNQLGADEEMDLFQQNVEQVNAEFYDTLVKKYPELSPADKKLCGLIRLNLSGKEIANVRKVDPATITKNKQRLRKKLNLPGHADLYAFMQNV